MKEKLAFLKACEGHKDLEVVINAHPYQRL